MNSSAASPAATPNPPRTPGTPGTPGTAPTMSAQTLAQQVIGRMLTRWGARFGVAWIAALVFTAVFAPLLANSHPILLKMNGAWSSPLLKHLTAPDVILFIAAFAGVILAVMKRVSFRYKLAVFFSTLVIAIPVCVVLIHPPQAVVYSQYREAQAQDRQRGVDTPQQIEFAVFAPIPYSPTDRLRDQTGVRLVAPHAGHWMGTEANGADVLSRMIHAARIALAIGFIATSIAVVIGVIIGGLMGFFSGVVDIVAMRLVEVFAAIPTLFLLIIFVAFFERNLYIMMAIIGLTSWVGYARFIRAEFLRLRQQDFVQAAIACGLPLRSILFRHMLPNGMAPVLVEASFGIASAILAESTLSFLGLGLVDKPSWGQMLNQALGSSGSFSWWIALYPGLAIFLTVFAYNLLGESLRDAIDPHSNEAPK